MKTFRAYDPDQSLLTDHEGGEIDTVLKTPMGMINGMWHIWACRRPVGKYKGRYPTGFLKRVYELIAKYNILPGFHPSRSMILHQFGGTTSGSKNEHTVDINAEVEPTFLTDARVLENVPSNSYDVVIADPPYDNLVDLDIIVEFINEIGVKSEDWEYVRDLILESFGKERDYSTPLYNCDPLPPYSFVNAGLRVLKPLGVYFILHQFSYITPMSALSWSDYDTKRIVLIGVTTGPNMTGRLLNGFRKMESDTTQQTILS